MATTYSTPQALKEAREARGKSAIAARHGVTLLELQKQGADLNRRLVEQEEYTQHLEECNSTLATHLKEQIIEAQENKQMLTTLFFISVIFCVLTFLCVGTVLYFPAGVYPFAAVAAAACLLFTGALALLSELL